ncbi:MAG: FtsX-like permease family protein [Lachnospiraceae bacterium]|nr:FtsX-like permease family protein [Lachnospiraceae bacterium]
MKNYEMKSYLSLIPISAKTHRKQNRLILLCIIFAVFLVTTVFSYAEIVTEGQVAAMIRKHGSHHIAIGGISREQADRIAGLGSVSASAWYRSFGEDIYEGYEVGGKRVILYGTQQAYIDELRAYEWVGVYPQNDKEVMLNETSKERLGVDLGDNITLHTPAGDFNYTITGFCVDEYQQYDKKYDGVCAYVSLSALDDICSMNGYGDNAAFYVRFTKGTDIKEMIANLKAQFGLDDGKIEENFITMGVTGASSNQTMNSLYLLAVVVFIMILTAGVLMISSCMNSMVSQRTKFFGMMRCIGASKKQIMHFVRLEALNWCKTAIPVGLGVSIVFTWVLCMILQYKVGGEFSDYPYRFSVIGIVSGILVGVISVLFAAHSPARRAAEVSPVAAVSGNAETGKKITHAANTRIFKVESALGVYHATAAKKNLILMSLSFAFTVALFLAFFAGLDLLGRFIPSENDLNPDISISAADNTNSLDRNMKEEIAKVSGVEDTFGCAISYDVPAEINGVSGSVDLISYDDFMFDWTKDAIASGDMAKVAGDTNNVLTIFNMDSRLDTGDKIKIKDTELEIACVASQGIGTENRPAIVCTEETFTRLTGEGNYIILGVQLTKDATEETVEAVQTIIGENDFLDRREDNHETNSSFWVFRMASYGFLGIIALITVFNIMNNISMSVSARMKQYGAMRAVGMSVDQMTKMIAAEAMTYAVSGLLLGYIVGLYLHRLIMVKLVFTHFGGSWTVPFEPLVIITAIVAVSCVVAVRTPARRIREMAITETINEL